MPKHVVAINGSSREQVTQHLLEDISERLSHHDILVSIISLKGKQIADCLGCEACIRRTSQCIHADDAMEILDQLVAADGIILASPVYLMQITGKLKSLIDKTASWVHRPVLVGKPILVAATTGGSGLKETLSYLEDVAIQWGAHPAGRIGRRAGATKRVLDREVARFVRCLQQPRSSYRPSLRQLIFFQVQKVLAIKLSSLDLAYWSERGWLQTAYFFPCHTPLHKRLLAKLVFQVLVRRVNPVETL